MFNNFFENTVIYSFFTTLSSKNNISLNKNFKKGVFTENTKTTKSFDF